MICDPTKPLTAKQEATHCVMVLFFMACWNEIDDGTM
jgi:hypothetical protein